MSGRLDVAIVGGGPAGLVAALYAARAGLSTVVVERSGGPPDKACGEGLMPSGVRVLEELGVRERLGAADCSPFVGIRYIQEDGALAEGRLPAAGLGIRRTALASALARRAEECGVRIHWGCTAERFTASTNGVKLATSGGELCAEVLVAADGLHSRLRRLAGLERPARLPTRFGLRRHFHATPWSEFVEVHVTDRVQAFVTPVGASRLGVAFLWERRSLPQRVSFDDLLARFPAISARLGDARPDSRPRGSGPLAQRAAARTADRLVLLGDAGGYVDAVTGEGLSLAFTCAKALAGVLPAAIASGATRESLRPYERAAAREYRRYALVCRSMLILLRAPRVRRPVLRFLGCHRGLFDTLIAAALA